MHGRRRFASCAPKAIRLAIIPAALALAALVALGLVAALCWALIVWDVLQYREHRSEVRRVRPYSRRVCRGLRADRDTVEDRIDDLAHESRCDRPTG